MNLELRAVCRVAGLPGGRRPIGLPAAGYMLIEYLIYIAVLAVVMEVGFSAFYRFMDHSRDLARNSEDILRVLRAGELWRSDIRLARSPPRVLSEQNLTVCQIEQRDAQVAYVFEDGVVWRQVNDDTPKPLVRRVRSSAVLEDRREKVTSWRWELELATRKKIVKVRPLFTFQAVAPAVPAKP